MEVLHGCFQEWKGIIRDASQGHENMKIPCDACQASLDCLLKDTPPNKKTLCKEETLLNEARFFWVQVAIAEHMMGICKNRDYTALEGKLERVGFEPSKFLNKVGKEAWKNCNTKLYFRCAGKAIIKFETAHKPHYCNMVNAYKGCLRKTLESCNNDQILDLWKETESDGNDLLAAGKNNKEQLCLEG